MFKSPDHKACVPSEPPGLGAGIHMFVYLGITATPFARSLGSDFRSEEEAFEVTIRSFLALHGLTLGWGAISPRLLSTTL